MNDLARRYAQALYGLTDDEKALRRTAGALMEDTTLWSALRSPAVRAEEKERILARLPDLEGCGTLLHFYQLLAVKGLFDVRMDPSLLGGFTLELEGVTYDKSVRGALAGLTRQLEERRMA